MYLLDQKKYWLRALCCMLLVGLFAAIGCHNETNEKYNRVVDALGINEIPENAVAVILNQPSLEQLNVCTQLTTLTVDNSGESLLLVPCDKKTEVKVEKLSGVGSDLEEDDFYKTTTADGYALHIQAVRPEGIPQLKISIESADQQEGEYYIAYDGRDGTPGIEYILQEQD